MFQKTAANNKTILVVDDNPGFLRLYSLVLDKAPDFTVHTCKNAFEALTLLQTVTPDLFILDKFMPRMSGIELTTIIRSRPQTINTPILMISATEDAIVALRAGVTEYLTKTALDIFALPEKARAMLVDFGRESITA